MCLAGEFSLPLRTVMLLSGSNGKAATPSEHPAPKHQDISVREQQEQGCSLKEGEVGAKGKP